MSISQMSNGFKKWKKQTSTSPSIRHLSHYKYLLILEKKDSQIDLLNKTMLMIHNTLINASLYNTTLLTRWTKSDVIMIPKIINTPQINRLRVINKFEADFNIVLNFVLAENCNSPVRLTRRTPRELMGNPSKIQCRSSGIN